MKTDSRYLELVSNPETRTETIQEFLTRARGLKIPRHDSKFTIHNARAWMRKLGLGETLYAQWEGAQSFRAAVLQFKAWNPEWSFKEWALLVSEHLEEISGAFQSNYSGGKGVA
jgi:hypothetical protein